MGIDRAWSLFLDRDGVINQRRMDDYVKNWSEFIFMPHAIETIAYFRQIFKHIFVVTNQQGIGKGLMTEYDLALIHQKMKDELEVENKTLLPIIDYIFHCPSLKSANDINRKPQIGMALQAKTMFQSVDFQRAIMVGDTISDMEFGKKAGMNTIFFGAEEIAESERKWIDYRCENWKAVQEQIKALIQNSILQN
ncbi:MAG: HAD-IIIA family hydrolase [Cytophagales bacterium]|nr:MAG: HAD-IIIA family hydrolase [Cytophagales bacterium]